MLEPHNPPEQLLSPHEIADLSLSSAITNPELIASALGGIGLGDTKDRGLGDNQPESPSSPESDYIGIIEAIKKQADVSAAAYSSAMQASNTSRKIASHNEYTQSLEESISEWQENGTLNFIAKEMKENAGLKYDLVAVPNFYMTDTSLKKIFSNFYSQQRLSSSASLPENFLHGPYDICGSCNESGNPVRFVLFPNKLDMYDAAKKISTPESLKKLIEEIQANNSAPVSLPSLMEGMFWWYTKKQQCISTTGDPGQKFISTDFHETYLNHVIEDDHGEKPLLIQSYISGKDPNVVDFNNIGFRLVLGK